MSELKQLEALFEQMPEGSGKEAVKEKIEKLKATEKSPKEEVEVQESVEEVVEEKPKKTRKPRAKKAAPKPKKATRFVFEKKVEGGKEVKVIEAMSEAEAKEAMEGADFEFVKQITRGRSPREGFVADKKAPAKKKEADKPKRKPRATKDDRTSMAKAAGMSETRAKKISEKVATGKKRGRKPMDKEAWLFEMPLKTQAGKVKRKIVKATNEQAAIKAAGQSYTLIRKLTEGEKPKVGTMDMEGYVAPPKRGRGRPKGVKNKAKAPSKPSEMPSKKSQAAIEAKSEDIGEGIAIADEVGKADSFKTLMSLHRELSTARSYTKRAMNGAEKILLNLQSAVEAMEELPDIVFSLARQEQKMAHGGTTHEKIKISDSDMKKLHEGKEVTISGVTLDFARGGRTSARERAALKKASKEMYDHLDKVRISLDDLGGVGRDNRGDFDWFDDSAGVGSDDKFMFQSEATEDFTKYLKKAYPAGKKMAHGGMHRQGYDDKLDESLGMRKGAGRTKEQSRKDRRDESAGMEKSMGRRKFASVGTMDKGRRKMAFGGIVSKSVSDELRSKGFHIVSVDNMGEEEIGYTMDGEPRMSTTYGIRIKFKNGPIEYEEEQLAREAMERNDLGDVDFRGVFGDTIDFEITQDDDYYAKGGEVKKKGGKKLAKGGSTEGKPKVESLTEVFMLMDGTEIDYEDMDDAEKMFGGDPLSPQDLVDKLAVDHDIYVMDAAPELFDLPDGDDEDDDEFYTGNVKDGVTIDDIEEAIEDELQGDNSYNYSAPFVFDVRFTKTDDTYDPQVMFAREHRGGDVRGNYGNYKAFAIDADTNPFYGNIQLYIITDKGDISMRAEELESYNFYVDQDETGIFGNDVGVNRDEIADALDFGNVKSETLYI